MLRRHTLIAAVLPLSPAALSQPVELEWVAGEMPPWSWTAASGPQGYAYDLVIAMAQRLGRPGKVTFYPWARAVRATEQGEVLGVFPLARTPDRESRFRWLVPLMQVRYVFLTLAADKGATLEELRQRRIGVLRGSPIIQNLKNERFQRHLEGKDYQDLLRMLSQRSIHAIYAGGPMLDAAIDQYGYERSQFATPAALGDAMLYIAASPRVADKEAELWLKAYAALEEDGTVARLRRKYLR